MITYKRATTDSELDQILEIQQRALKANTAPEDRIKEGYLTAVHDFDLLKSMNSRCPHIIAMDGDKVAGFALTMTRDFRNALEILIPMFNEADVLLKDSNYLVMGQICIDKEYRGKGLFKGLYTFYKQELSNEYDYLVTEVASGNPRSLGAHKSVGFETLRRKQALDGTSWKLMYWDWNNHPERR